MGLSKVGNEVIKRERNAQIDRIARLMEETKQVRRVQNILQEHRKEQAGMTALEATHKVAKEWPNYNVWSLITGGDERQIPPTADTIKGYLQRVYRPRDYIKPGPDKVAPIFMDKYFQMLDREDQKDYLRTKIPPLQEADEERLNKALKKFRMEFWRVRKAGELPKEGRPPPEFEEERSLLGEAASSIASGTLRLVSLGQLIHEKIPKIGLNAMADRILAAEEKPKARSPLRGVPTIPLEERGPDFMSSEWIRQVQEESEVTERRGELRLERPLGEELTDPHWYVRNVFETVPQLAAGGAATYFGGPAGGFVVMGTIEGGYHYQDAIRAGVDPRTATLEAMAVGTINGALEMLPLARIVGKVGKPAFRTVKRSMIKQTFHVLKEGGTQASYEGITEAIQEIVQAGVAELGHDPSDEFFDVVGQSVRACVIGAVLGGVMGSGAGIAQTRTQTLAPIRPEETQITREQIMEAQPERAGQVLGRIRERGLMTEDEIQAEKVAVENRVEEIRKEYEAEESKRLGRVAEAVEGWNQEGGPDDLLDARLFFRVSKVRYKLQQLAEEASDPEVKERLEAVEEKINAKMDEAGAPAREDAIKEIINNKREREGLPQIPEEPAREKAIRRVLNKRRERQGLPPLPEETALTTEQTREAAVEAEENVRSALTEARELKPPVEETAQKLQGAGVEPAVAERMAEAWTGKTEQLYAGLPLWPKRDVPEDIQRSRANLGPEAQRAQDIFDQQRQEQRNLNKGWGKRIIAGLGRTLWDASGPLKRLLRAQKHPKAIEAVERFELKNGATAYGHRWASDAVTDVWEDLSGPAEEELLADYLQAVRTVEVDNVMRQRVAKEAGIPEAQVEQPIKHPGGMTKEQARAWIRDRFQALNPETRTRIEEAGKEYWTKWNNVLEFQHKNGLLSDEGYNFLRQNHQHYNPRLFIQHIDPVTRNQKTLMGRKVSLSESGIKALDEGSEQMLVNNPRSFLTQGIVRAVNRVKINKANQSLREFAREAPDNGLVREAAIEDISDEGNPQFEDTPQDMENIDLWVEGRKRRLFMRSDIAQDWTRANSEISNVLASWLRVLSGAKAVKLVATGINPAFALTNVPRDAGLIWAQADSPYSNFLPVAAGQMISDWAAVVKDVVTRKGRTNDYLREGGGMDYLTTQYRSDPTRGFEKATKFQRVLGKVQDLVAFIGTSSELLTRLGLRERAIKQGHSPEEATHMARNYLDFAQGGTFIKAADTVIPYLNAATQAMRSAVRSGVRDPALMTWKIAQLVTAASMVTIYSLIANPEGYEKVSADMKNRYFIFMLPKWLSATDPEGQTRHRYFSVPKPEFVRPFAAIGEAMVEWMKTGQTPSRDFLDLMASSKDVVPVSSGSMPPALNAVLAGFGNYDTWRMEPVWKGRRVEPSAEFNVWTHPFWKKAGEVTGLSPERTARAASKIFPQYNPLMAALRWKTRLLMEDLPKKGRAYVRNQMLREVTGARRFLRTTPVRTKKESEKRWEPQQKITTKQHRANVALDRKFSRGSSKKEIREWVLAKDDPNEQERLFRRWEALMKEEGLDPFWLDLMDMNPEARAAAFLDRYRRQDDDGKDQMWTRADHLGGILTDRFYREFKRLYAQREREK